MKPCLTILVVEGSAAVRAVLTMILASSGHRVALAAGAGAARGLLQVRRPDLILIDYDGSDAENLELVREVRRSPDFDAVPIFVLSGEESRGARSLMAAEGANAWIAKPICRPVLMSAIAAAAESLGRSSARSAAGRVLAPAD